MPLPAGRSLLLLCVPRAGTGTYTHPHSGTRKPQAAVSLPVFMSSAYMSEQQLADRLEPLLSRPGAVCGPSGLSGRETRIDPETVSSVEQVMTLVRFSGIT